MTPEPDPEQAVNRAIGWLVEVVNRDHPGYLSQQADRAEGIDPLVAAQLRSWVR